MTEQKKIGGRFAGLKALREQASDQQENTLPTDDDLEIVVETEPDILIQEQPLVEGTSAVLIKEITKDKVKPKEQPRKIVEQQQDKRGPGRPQGRRSNPDYTQISAYVPLDLLLDVQHELNQEKRVLRSRTAMSVSELVEDLLTDWLKKRKLKSSK